MSMIQKQIEELQGLAEWMKQNNIVGGRIVLDAINTIQSLSAKLQAKNFNDGWIPCSNMLPMENGKYLVTYEDDVVGRYVIERNFCNGKFEPMRFYEEKTNRKPIAWQPLPSPFKE